MRVDDSIDNARVCASACTMVRDSRHAAPLSKHGSRRLSYPNPDPESGPGRTQIRHKIRPDSGYSYSFRKCNSKANPGELCKRSPKTHETQMTAGVHYTSQWCACTYTALPAPQASPSRHCLLRCCCAGWHGHLRPLCLLLLLPIYLRPVEK